MSRTHTQPLCTTGATTTGGPSSSSSSPSPAGGSTSPANVLHVQPEKPQHYTYLKEFRTEQCPLFVQHKCTQHRPFACFYWHFLNQRRRRPMRRRDGTFNYSPDIYCTKYDEGTGTCPEGDECPFLHRTAGDTERRYHLRYYKTGSCIHETDSKGHCSKNGSHCAFAHGSHDLRCPVYDIREVQVLDSGASGPGEEGGGGGGGDSQSGQAASTALIEKILSEEPRWQDTTYVLSHYKTELCKKPPRLCRQGYACPYYHNSKDRRRSPHKHKYRALPCPSVKHSEEWGDPSKCEGAEGCQYCHTRTEQQFHPEIYKSTKCNDMHQCGSCPRGPFCAFAHLDKPPITEEPSCPPHPGPPEPHSAHEVPTSPGGLGLGPGSQDESFSPSGGGCMAEQGILGRVLSMCEDVCGGGEPLSPWAGEGGYGRAPGFEREDQAKQRGFALEQRSREMAVVHSKQDLLVFLPVGSPLSLSSSVPSSLAATPPSPAPPGPPGQGLSSGMNANALPFYPTSDTVESVVESALDDLDLNDFGMSALERSLDSSSAGVMLGGNQLQSSAPVNIPGSLSSSIPFTPPSPSPPIRTHPSPFFSAHLSQPGQSESSFLGPSHGSLGLNGMNSSIWEHFPSGQASPSTTPTLLPSPTCPDPCRLRQELDDAHRTLKHWDHTWKHTPQPWEVLKADAENSRALAGRLALEAERGRQAEEEAQRQSSLLQGALESLRRGENPHQALGQLQLLQHMPLESVLSLQAQLCSCLQAVEQVVYRKQGLSCVACGEQGSVTLPCGHGLHCDACFSRGCPLCSDQTPGSLS
ncbi:LOW QUALITY PROTEIN: RING finger protein unkempt homolog [Hypomesus transpacificus]|uniref:LOW QUALITY PROTEIN: RING finger protein unkempt homolog n=1 Tax=Hypomesus transpacificus TaxID=137520 RepID=UPI001F075CA8|nr:LOW QUALITY PROTEIN: RING finger protein unkempt homolog [Hypomesus transpacificus]